MENYIKSIKINKIFHLQDFEIKIEDAATPHLFITGKNGSGKTVLLDAIGQNLDYIHSLKKQGYYIQSGKDIVLKFGSSLLNNNFYRIYGEEDFIFVHYRAERKPKMKEPNNPTKPNLNSDGIVSTLTDQFLYFLSDLKIQEALARNEGLIDEANVIKDWFNDFKNILRNIFGDNDLELKFNIKDYSFMILTEGKSFKFTQLSDGFSAIIDIVADIILKMQGKDSLSSSYNRKGIVLIDEIETHLHLELQRNIMPFLTKVFPNIQFIVTTHSPFVLNSIPNAVAFDLESREIIDELNEYSYEALAEGYFGVNTSSSYLDMRLSEFENLLAKEDKSLSDKYEIKCLIEDFGKISEAVSPVIIGRFNELRLEYSEVIKSL